MIFERKKFLKTKKNQSQIVNYGPARQARQARQAKKESSY